MVHMIMEISEDHFNGTLLCDDSINMLELVEDSLDIDQKVNSICIREVLSSRDTSCSTTCILELSDLYPEAMGYTTMQSKHD